MGGMRIDAGNKLYVKTNIDKAQNGIEPVGIMAEGGTW